MNWQFLVIMGIPTAVTGFLVWWLEYRIKQRDAQKAEAERKEKAEREEKEKNTETLMLMIMQTSRATNVLAKATAVAVSRIPDAHCNGDMKAALEKSDKIQQEEQAFLIDQGVKRIFGD